MVARPGGAAGRETGGPAARPRDMGAVAVETALVLPLLLVLIFGIIDLGRMLNAQITVTEAAREGARAESLNAPDPVARARMLTDQLDGAPGAVDFTTVPCAAVDPTRDAEMTVRYAFTFVTPLGALVGLVGGDGAGLSGTLTVTGKGAMPCMA